MLVRVRNKDNNTYWDGNAWVTDSNTWIPATGTTSWTLNVPMMIAGDYRIAAYSIDNAGNVEEWADGRPNVALDVF